MKRDSTPDPTQIRVLQITHALSMGGAETWLMELLRLWAKTGAVQMDFLLTGGNRGLFDDEAQQLGARIFYVPFQKTRLLSFAGQFRRILQAGRYAAIHDHADYISGWHFLMGAGQLPPVRIAHVHNAAYQIRNNYGVTPVRRLTASVGAWFVSRFATHIAGTSWRVLTDYGFDGSQFQRQDKCALHCGFHPERFLGDHTEAKPRLCREFGWPEDSKIILFAGRIDRSIDPMDTQANKNAPFAIDVGMECCRKDSHVRMLLAGALSPAVKVLEARIAAAGCSGKIVFGGIRRDIERLMLACDVLLFPSRGEGLGMVAVEAQAAGLPVVASTAVPRECVVVPELVQFLEVDGDAKRWAAVVETLLANHLRTIHQANAFVQESPFAIRNSAAALQRLYSSRTPDPSLSCVPC